MTNIICITCPKGCHLSVDEQNDCAVTSNACPRGAEYGRNEVLHPVRVVTSTVRLEGGALPRLPVKTDRPLPKEKVFDCMRLLDGLTVTAPVKTGQVIAAHILGTDVDIVATRSL
ncbi:MAG: DUF1667 domain-containing protein [Eubacteriales bacterium]|nr:DUF1667 domain-containing protein [Eubacteriales bacterium]